MEQSLCGEALAANRDRCCFNHHRGVLKTLNMEDLFLWTYFFSTWGHFLTLKNFQGHIGFKWNCTVTPFWVGSKLMEMYDPSMYSLGWTRFLVGKKGVIKCYPFGGGNKVDVNLWYFWRDFLHNSALFGLVSCNDPCHNIPTNRNGFFEPINSYGPNDFDFNINMFFLRHFFRETC